MDRGTVCVYLESLFCIRRSSKVGVRLGGYSYLEMPVALTP